LTIGGLSLYSYGAAVALGGLLSFGIWSAQREKMGLRKDDDLWMLVNAILLGGFVGGRILYLLEYETWFGPGFWSAAFALNRGFSVLGAFFGVTGAVWLFSRRAQVGFFRILDHVALAAPLWHVFGRLGCFAAGCCYGRPSERAWSVAFTDPRAMVPAELLGRRLHPAQLYEAGGDLAIFLFLLLWVRPRVGSGRWSYGGTSGAYLTAYGALRFALEPFRGDTVPAGLGFSAGQWLAAALVASGLALTYRSYHRCIRH
jgi:phosphatidylglycerol:prolipoprotein diacylglycerol transferase